MGAAQSNARFILRDFLPYLTNRAGVKTGLVFDRDLRGFGISLFGWRVLSALWENENLCLNDIAETIVADLSTTSRQVKRLARAGLVARTQSDADRRALSLVLTAEGREVTRRIIPIARLHEQVATRGVGPADLAVLRRSLIRIYENLSEFERSGTKKAGGTQARRTGRQGHTRR